ncbi:MAG: hypothetical protein J6W64_08395 [Bacilli bacterium]|nr:hypothetical protein [Bacilli bacterium]MBO7536099.1 hypothetical protein [Bacilli bacterium]
MVPINPCKILEEICHLAVFFKVVKNPDRCVPIVTSGLSAAAIDCANYANAACPLLPADNNLLDNSDKSVLEAFKLELSAFKLSLPVSVLIALFKCTDNSFAA